MNVVIQYFKRYKVYFKSAGLYLFGSLFSAAIKILINPVMARNLSHSDYAIIGYFGSFSLLFLPLLSFSLTSYYLRHYYMFSEEKRERVANTILLSLLVIGIVTSVFILTGFYFFLKINEVEFPFWPYASFTVFQIVFNNFLAMLQITYRIRREAKKFVTISITSTITWLLLALLLVVVLKLGAIGSMGANLMIAFGFGMYSFLKVMTKFEFDVAILKEAVKFCWPLFGSAILWYFLSGIDRVFLEKLDDIKKFALYNIGAGISGYLAILYTSIAQTFEPDIYKAIAGNKLKKLITIVLGIILINAVPVIIFILLAYPLTYILTGGRYADAADFARILSLKNISTSMYYSVITVIVGFGYTKTEFMLRLIGAVISVTMYKVLIDFFGFYGAAWGQVFSFLMMAMIGTTFLIYKYRKTNGNLLVVSMN